MATTAWQPSLAHATVPEPKSAVSKSVHALARPRKASTAVAAARCSAVAILSNRITRTSASVFQRCPGSRIGLSLRYRPSTLESGGAHSQIFVDWAHKVVNLQMPDELYPAQLAKFLTTEGWLPAEPLLLVAFDHLSTCLLYTSDAADE